MLRRPAVLGPAPIAAVACFIVLALMSLTAAARADDIAVIRQRAWEQLTLSGQAVDWSDPQVKSNAASLVAAAQRHHDAWMPTSQTCADGSVRKGSWADIDYCDIGQGAGWQPSNHFSRLLAMAEAYRMPMPGSSLYGSTSLLARIEQALAVVSYAYGGGARLGGGGWVGILVPGRGDGAYRSHPADGGLVVAGRFQGGGVVADLDPVDRSWRQSEWCEGGLWDPAQRGCKGDGGVGGGTDGGGGGERAGAGGGAASDGRRGAARRGVLDRRGAGGGGGSAAGVERSRGRGVCGG